MGGDVPIERRGWKTISNFGCGVNSLTPEWRWEVARDHHGTDHIHECSIHTFGDAVGGAGICGGLFVRDAVLFKECGDSFECFPTVFASFIRPKVNQGSTRLILHEGEPFSEDSKDS